MTILVAYTNGIVSIYNWHGSTRKLSRRISKNCKCYGCRVHAIIKTTDPERGEMLYNNPIDYMTTYNI